MWIPNICFFYGHYIDDLLLVWQSDVIQLSDFIAYLNTYDDSLQFTMEHQPDTINYLDVSLFHQDNLVHIKLYRTPKSENGLLQADSCHPNHIIKNLPIGEYVRARKSCSLDTGYSEECYNIDCRLQQQGYLKLLNRARSIVNNKNRHLYLFTPKQIYNTNILTFATPYITK